MLGSSTRILWLVKHCLYTDSKRSLTRFNSDENYGLEIASAHRYVLPWTLKESIKCGLVHKHVVGRASRAARAKEDICDALSWVGKRSYSKSEIPITKRAMHVVFKCASMSSCTRGGVWSFESDTKPGGRRGGSVVRETKRHGLRNIAGMYGQKRVV